MNKQLTNKTKYMIAAALAAVVVMSISFASMAEIISMTGPVAVGDTAMAAGPGGSAGPGSSSGVSATDVYKDSLKGIEDDTKSDTIGPKVEEISLVETYYDEFECYSESFNGAAYVYSNCNNNGITDKAVYVDIPANVAFTMSKDGVERPYESNSMLSEYGSYRFAMEVVKDPDVPMSEQTIYKAVFNFRIAKRMKEKSESDSGERGLYYYPNYSNSYYVNGDGITPAQQPQPTATETQPQVEEHEKIVFEDELDPDHKDLEDLEDQKEFVESQEEAEQPKTELDFDIATGYYTKKFEDGSYFRCDVPNGAPVNYAVHIDSSNVQGGKDAVIVMKDGEQIDYPEEDLVNTGGEYILQIPNGSGTYNYSFSIYAHPVKGGEEIVLPKIITLQKATLNDQPTGFTRDADGKSHVPTNAEGTYTLSMVDENFQSLTTDIVIDRTSPVVTVEKEKKKVVLKYENESEIDKLVIHQNKETYERTIMFEFTDPGKYSIDVYDFAGNSTTVEFVIKKSINPASVIAVLLIIGIIGAGAGFFWKIRNKSQVK